ncbi:MAG: DNA topoisomerase VI subunit B [Candidatus Thorarchaeota archaeon]|nr:DNA topoisomerase VI subunit B [Candidatus Thorarchaeota archaeon]
MLTTNSYSSDITELSVSAWFYRNRTIAGFDNPARSLYVSIRELVENSLDACEDGRVLPNVSVLLRREDETDQEQDVLSSGPEIFELVVKDNGKGIRKDDIPVLIGKMLTGTKFMLKQSRGTFGLGGSLALLYGQVTTQEPIEVVTGRRDEEHGYRIVMRLDIEANQPIIIKEEIIEKSLHEHGTLVSYKLQGDWIRSKKRIIDYFAKTAIIVPYASLLFDTPDGEVLRYDGLIDKLPVAPKEMKPHPRGIDVELLKKMISTTRAKTMKSFMKSSFQRVGISTAEEFLAYSGLDAERGPSTLEQQELVALMKALAGFGKFLPPSPKSLSPASTEVLAAGVQRLSPDFAVFKQRSPNVYEGHPFVVETGVAYGGGLDSGINVYRFANRIPLLYDERSDVTYRVVRDLNLRNYGLRKEDPLVFVMHICSTKIPYKTVGKEYIGDVDIVRREIELGFKECLREVGDRVRRRDKVQKQRKRENRLTEYYAFMAGTLASALNREVSSDTLIGSEGGEIG